MYYFVSDTHIGAGYDRLDNESRFVAWLRLVERDAKEIFMAGDIFDFWFEYRRVVPKGFSTVFATLREITSKGIKVHFFPGNHDMWVGDYFIRECGLDIHHEGLLIELDGKKIYIDHGDKAVTGNFKAAFTQTILRSKLARSLFSALVHPDLALKLGQWWSGQSRRRRDGKHCFRMEDEPIVRFCRRYLQTHEVDYFVFGHLHCVEEYALGKNSTLFMLGGWIDEKEPVYGTLDKGVFSLRAFRP